MRHMVLPMVFALATAAAGPANADDVHPYLFTQSHSGTKQIIAKGVPVQVQLPAGPTTWRYIERQSRGVRLIKKGSYPSPGRIDGTSSIQTFTFDLSGPVARIVIWTQNSAPILKPLVKGGRYQLDLKTGRR